MVVLPSDGPLKKLLDERPVITEVANYSWWVRGNKINDEEKINDYVNSFSSLLNLLPRIKSFNPDVIYTNTVSIPWGAITAILLNRPHVWHIREFGKIDHNFNFDLEEKETKKFINATSNYVFTNSNAIRGFYKDLIDEKNLLPHITIFQFLKIF